MICKKYLIAVFLFISICFGIFSQVNISFLSVENLSKDPKYNYLTGIIQGILLYDLSNVTGITLSDRSNLDKILEEQKLQLSGVLSNEKKALEIGKLIGADVLVHAGFVFLGDDLLINVTLIDVRTGKSNIFSERGRTENTVHILAEKTVTQLIGSRIEFASFQTERSIISLKDESPGRIALYCNLIDAEILIDEEFIGYTSGNSKVPVELLDIKPGKHILKIKLGNEFGVVKLPEFTFHHWEQEIEIHPGRQKVVKASISHHNNTIYKAMKLLSVDVDLREGQKTSFSDSKDLSFVDRESNEIKIDFSISADLKGDECNGVAKLIYNGKEHNYKFKSGDKKIIENIGKVKIELYIDNSSSYKQEVEYDVIRTDLKQGMFRK